jgi:hypothetical protein
MSNQRVVVLTDDEIGAVFHPPVHRADAQCSCDDCVAQRNLRSKLMAALEHPEGITDEMVERGVDWAMLSSSKLSDRRRYRPYVRKLLEAALFPGGER